jgi:hypothetical protein
MGNATFSGTSYNGGEVAGDATFLFYTGVDGVVTITNDSNFMGTGEVAGEVRDSIGVVVTDWELVQGSVLQAFLAGHATFSDTSKNFGTVAGDVYFYNKSDNSGGIVEGNGHFLDTSFNGGIVLGNGHFYDEAGNQ